MALEFAASDILPGGNEDAARDSHPFGDPRFPAYGHAVEEAGDSGGDAETGTPIVLSFLPAFQEIIHNMRIGKSAAEISVRFHAAVVDGCVDMVERINRRSGLRCVALSGGSFQNALLLRGMIASLRERNYTVLSHTQVPANDGGIALGQALAALWTGRAGTGAPGRGAA